MFAVANFACFSGEDVGLLHEKIFFSVESRVSTMVVTNKNAAMHGRPHQKRHVTHYARTRPWFQLA